jgi:hydroxymethylbilane synthase
MWQTSHVQGQLGLAGQATEIIKISTQGDLIQDVPLHQIGQIGLFTSALDDALKSGKVDAAVHSAKDLPSTLDDDLEIAAFLKREDPRDVLVANRPEVHFENLNQPWVIGTSSVRRQALLRHYVPGVQIKDIRGNVDTRLAKLEAGDYDGIILAYAGLNRLGLEHHIRQKLNLSTFTPAIGQGAIAVVVRKGYIHKKIIHDALDHEATGYALEAERAYLRTLQGGCHTPAFAFANVVGDQLSMTAGIGNAESGSLRRVEDTANVSEAVSLGKKLAHHILEYVNPKSSPVS